MATLNNNLKKVLGILMTIMSMIAMFVIVMHAFGDDIWYDEVFSMRFADSSVRELIELTAADVHPPLYYLYLKAIVGIGTFFTKGMYAVRIAKLASVIPWIVLLVIAVIYIRRRYGLFVMGGFLMMITCMPQISNYYVEIRMYSLAMMFVTVAALTALEIVLYGNTWLRWIIFFIAGILTAYTQYYALIAIVGIYIALFIALCIKKSEIKSRHKSQRFVIYCAVVSVAMYIPWLPTVLRQIAAVKSNYWIEPLTIRSLAGCAKYIFLPMATSVSADYTAAGIMLAATAAIAVMWLVTKPAREDVITAVILLLPIVVVILTGYVLSIIGTPIFVYRYMIPAVAILWLELVIMLDKASPRQWSAVIIVAYLFGAVMTLRGFYEEEHKKLVESKRAFAVINSLPQGSTVITNFDHVTMITAYYRPDIDVYLYENDADPLIERMFVGRYHRLYEDKCYELVTNEDNVYFFGSFNSRDDIVAQWESFGIESRQIDSVLMERYWFNIYEESVR